MSQDAEYEDWEAMMDDPYWDHDDQTAEVEDQAMTDVQEEGQAIDPIATASEYSAPLSRVRQLLINISDSHPRTSISIHTTAHSCILPFPTGTTASSTAESFRFRRRS